jgi:agmatinase
VPVDFTTSYHSGAAQGPQAIFDASPQLDLFDTDFGAAYQYGIYYHPESKSVQNLNRQYTPVAQALQEGGIENETHLAQLEKLNEASTEINRHLYQHVSALLADKKIVGTIGGDHAAPLGSIKAHAEHYSELGLLHIDAHADLRIAYQGFKYSHASIMYNVLQESSIKQILQLGIRDACQQEVELAASDARISTCYKSLWDRKVLAGESFVSICNEAFKNLPKNVYISFDIDGLEPALCPGTGTPVPGGFSFSEFKTILYLLVESGRTIVGFDICEVAPTANDRQFNGNVGARALHQLIGYTLKSNAL